MKRLIVVLVAVALFFGFTISASASDWDVAGKVLTGIEGLRIVTGNRVDLVGNLMGFNNRDSSRDRDWDGDRDRGYRGRDCSHQRIRICKRVWVPNYVWVRKWVPRHKEIDKRGHERIIEGHFEKYQIEKGGHWQYACNCNQHKKHID